MLRLRLIASAAAVLLITPLVNRPQAAAQLQKVSDISLTAKRLSWNLLDPFGRFYERSMVVTGDGTLLVLTASRDGIWELYRLRGWNSDKPQQDRLALPGYFSKRDTNDLEDSEAHLFLTNDGAYAIATSRAYWLKRVHGKAVGSGHGDNVVSVVDLSRFTVVTTRHTKDLGNYEFQEVRMDLFGRLLFHSAELNNQRRGAFQLLETPELNPGIKCQYKISPDDSNHYDLVTREQCKTLLRGVSFDDYVKTPSPFPPRTEKFACISKDLEYCPRPNEFSTDRKFAFGIVTEGHDNLLGSWVQVRASLVVFSAVRREEIGTFGIAHVGDDFRFATTGGEDYLLALSFANQFKAYRITDPQAGSPPTSSPPPHLPILPTLGDNLS